MIGLTRLGNPFVAALQDCGLAPIISRICPIINPAFREVSRDLTNQRFSPLLAGPSPPRSQRLLRSLAAIVPSAAMASLDLCADTWNELVLWPVMHQC
jgi:hypothetical protein